MTMPNLVQKKLRRAALQVLGESGAFQVNVSELAKTAGVARGTVYNNLPNAAVRYEDLSEEMTNELTIELEQALISIDDPVFKVAAMVRWMLRKAAQDRVWCTFILRFILVNPQMKRFWANLPAKIMENGRASGEFKLDEIPTPTVTSHMGGSVLMAMFYIHNKQRDWDSLSQETVYLILLSMGVDMDKAKKAASAELDAPDYETFAERKAS